MKTGATTLSCDHCGTVVEVPACNCSRTFMRCYQRFRREHDWRCSTEARIRREVAEAEAVVASAIAKANATSRR